MAGIYTLAGIFALLAALVAIPRRTGEILLEGTSTQGDGVRATRRISATSSHAVRISGKAAGTGGNGVIIAGTGADVSAREGGVEIVAESSGEDGLRIDSGASVSTTGTGPLSITGTSLGQEKGDAGVVIYNARVAAVDGEVVLNGTGIDGVALAAGSSLQTSGTGAISIDAQGSAANGLAVIQSSTVQTVDGLISLRGKSTSGTGVIVDQGSQIGAGGAADIRLVALSEQLDALRVQVGSKISAKGPGNILLSGESNGTRGGGRGIVIRNSQITATGGDIEVQGRGKFGIVLSANGEIGTLGTGAVRLIGVGNELVQTAAGIELRESRISSENGDIVITDGSSKGNRGVALSASQIQSTGIGNVRISASGLIMDPMAVVEAGGDARVESVHDVTISRIAARGKVHIASASGRIRNLGEAPHIRGEVVTLGGEVAPGLEVGVLRIEGDLQLDDHSCLSIQIDGAEPGEGLGFHDQVHLSGQLRLGDRVGLHLAQRTHLPPGTCLVAVNQRGESPVEGVFANLAEGNEVLAAGEGASGQRFRISYQGGDGNDVVLVVVGPESQ